VYRSVFTTLHGLAWSDMSFFSEPDRHGDPAHPYPLKRIPSSLIGAVIVLGFVPELLAAVGFIVTIRRPLFLPLAIMCVVGVSAYVWWFVSQDSWALKTKYLLFLVPVRHLHRQRARICLEPRAAFRAVAGTGDRVDCRRQHLSSRVRCRVDGR
jgi:hypothetical protein